MRPGKLDQRITIEEELNVSDGMGGSSHSWSVVKTTWANVKPSSGQEREFNQQLAGEHTNIFTVRNNLTIENSYRIVWSGDNYNIKSIAKSGVRKMYLVIAAERGVAT